MTAHRIVLTCALILAPCFASVADAQGGSVQTSPTIRVELAQQEKGGTTVEILKAASSVVVALAWPAVFTVLLLTQKKALKELLNALIAVVNSSTRIKLGEMLDVEVDRSARDAATAELTTSREVPTEEVQAATRVSRYVGEAELPTIRERMLAFAREYEATRSNMKPGPERTRRMNAIVAKMRTLAIAARPLLHEFMSNAESPGTRLCAISILQLSPSLDAVDWLVQRMPQEQPFVMFNASMALLATVRSYGSISGTSLEEALKTALATVQSFKAGAPDRNTVETLEAALSELSNLTRRTAAGAS